MRYSLGLFFVLTMFWLINSPNISSLLLFLGLISVCLVVTLIVRMKLLDRESLPLHLIARIIPFYLWLLKEIVLSSLNVLKKIVFPRQPLKPQILTIKLQFNEPLTEVIFANSITLVPGTLCLKLSKSEITIHALSKEFASTLRTGELTRRLKRLEELC